MTRILQVAASVVILALVSACGMSNADIQKTVKRSMEESFRENRILRAHDVRVDDLHVVKVQGNIYRGIATLRHKGSFHQVPVDIIVDGRNVIWEVDPEAFSFILEWEINHVADGLNELLHGSLESLLEFFK